MVDSTIKFNLINNKSFHNKLERKLLDEPVDASNSLFDGLSLDLDGKCYYPLFLREPFSLKDFDFCKLIDPEHLQQLKDKQIIPENLSPCELIAYKLNLLCDNEIIIYKIMTFLEKKIISKLFTAKKWAIDMNVCSVATYTLCANYGSATG